MLPILQLPIVGTVPTFFLLVSLGVSLALVWLHFSPRPRFLAAKELSDLSLVLILGGFLGARLLHIFYEEPAYYFENPDHTLYFWRGGFVYFGGLIGAVIAGHIYAYKKSWSRHQVLEIYDLMAPPAALTYALGRIGCLFNGCCFGKQCEAWYALQGRWPTTLVAALIEVLIFAVLLFARKKQLPPGGVFFIWLPAHGLNRLLMESQRADFRGPSLGLSISSWISLLLISISIIYWIRQSRPNK